MTVTPPDGWTNFQGGGSDPELCGESPPTVSPPGSLTCVPGFHEVGLVVEGGTPPFTWETTGGILTVTGLRTATLSLATLNNLIHYYVPYLCHYYSECPGGDCAEGKTNAVIDSSPGFRGYDCLGHYVADLDFLNRIGDPLDTPPYSNVNWSITPHNTGCVEGSVNEILNFHDTDPPSAVFKTGCCDPGGTVDWVVDISIAGVLTTQGVVWSGALPFHGSGAGFPPNSVCNSPPGCQEVPWDVTTGQLDVRTQAMIDAGCCTTPTGSEIIVTVTDGAGHTETIIIPVV